MPQDTTTTKFRSEDAPSEDIPTLVKAVGSGEARDRYKIALTNAGQLEWNDFKFVGHIQKWYLNEWGGSNKGLSKMVTFYRLDDKQSAAFLRELGDRLKLAEEGATVQELEAMTPDEVANTIAMLAQPVTVPKVVGAD